jgi:tetratricopeptide (TPR) repeat protein
VRVNELGMITKRLAGLLVKRPSVTVGLWGSPGIGKTFAAQQLLRETPCQSLSLYATTNPAQLALALPRPKKLQVWAERSLEKIGSGEFVETAAITDACGTILSGLAPFVLHLEDVHEVAPEQLEFIQNLARVVERLKGVGLIVTSRTEPPEPFGAVQLQPLSSEESRRMLEREAGAPLPNECVEWIEAKAVGNPLYTLEFFRFLARQGFVWNDGQRWRWRKPDREIMPVTVEALIAQTLVDATDTPTLQDVLGAKAVLPIGSSEALWASVSGDALEIVQNARVELEQRGVLVNGEFTHPLYREVIHQGLTAERRQVFARRAIEMLEPSRPLEASEFVFYAELGTQRSLEILERAATQMRERLDWVSVGRLLAQAVKYAHGEHGARLAVEAANHLRSTDLGEATRLAELAVALVPGRPESIYLLAGLLSERGRADEVERVLAQLPESEASGMGWIMLQIKRYALIGDQAKAIDLWRAHPEVIDVKDAELIYRVSYGLSALGFPKEAIPIAVQALEWVGINIADRCKLTDVVARGHYFNGDYAQAAHFFDEAYRLAIISNDTEATARILLNRGNTLGLLGKYQEMIKSFQEAIQLYLKIGNLRVFANAQSKLGYVYIDFGNYQRAEEVLLASMDIFSRMDVSEARVDCQRNLANLYLSWKPAYGLTLALKYAHDALRDAEQLNSPRNILNALVPMARVEVWRGQALNGLAFADRAFEIAKNLKFRFGLAISFEARGRALDALGRREEAITAFRAAEVELEALGTIESNLIGLEVDRLLNDSTSAAHRLALFRSSERPNLVEAVYRYFPQLGPGSVSMSELSNASLVRIGVLGPMQVSLGGQSEPVRGRKRQELLALLLEARIAGRAEISKLQLLDALYPDSDEDQAVNALQETVRAARSSLSTDVIQTTQNGYALGAVTSDVEEFLRSGNTNLWRGAYLDGLRLETRDDTVRESLHLALFSAAANTLETDAREAARVGRLLLEFDPYNLEYLELCVKALRATSNHKSLTRLYTDARDRLSEVGEAIPERWQDFLERSTLKT